MLRREKALSALAQEQTDPVESQPSKQWLRRIGYSHTMGRLASSKSILSLYRVQPS